jgi:hypothetical protein
VMRVVMHWLEKLTALMIEKESSHSKQLARAAPAHFLDVSQRKSQLTECSIAFQKFL